MAPRTIEKNEISANPMRLLQAYLLLVAGLILVGCGTENPSTGGEVSTGDVAQCDPDNGGITLPDGFCASVFADGLGRARHITVRDNGDVFVILRGLQDGNGLVALRDADGDAKAETVERFGDIAGTGIGIYDDHLYASSETSVIRYPLQADSLLPAMEAQTVIASVPERGQHAAKPFTFDEQGNIYVNVGAPSNACQEQSRTQGSPGQDPCPLLDQFGGIWRFDASGMNQTQEADGHRFATGIRNAVALTWHDGELFAVMHGRDQLSQLFPDLYTAEENAELPAEEFLRASDGDDFGWPYCYYDQIQGKKVLAPEYGGDGEEVGRCDQFEDPIIGFPGHYAPNDIKFYTAGQFPAPYQGGAFIAFHGSWNRAPLEQQGYLVAFAPFEGGQATGDWEVFADGFKGTDSLDSPGNAEFRPMAVAIGPDGSLYIGDSVKGRIWKVMYTGS